IAEGGDSLTVATPSRTTSHVTYRISNASGLAVRTLAGNSTNSDPPSYDTGLADRDILWIATRSGDSNIIPSARPSGYSTMIGIQAANTSGVSTHAAHLATSLASEDPGIFTVNTEQWVANTIAVFSDVEVSTQTRGGGTFATSTPGFVAWSNPNN